MVSNPQLPSKYIEKQSGNFGTQHNFCILNTWHLFFVKSSKKEERERSQKIEVLDYLSEIVTENPGGYPKRMEGVFVIITKA